MPLLFRFKIRYSIPIEDARTIDATRHQMEIGEKATTELQDKLRPYFLQRLKKDYLADKLPEKKDYVVWTNLSKRQRAMYELYVNAKDSAANLVITGMMSSPLQAITYLKKLCAHPFLTEMEGNVVDQCSDPEILKKYSAKLAVLDALVERLVGRGPHRVLIFSQSTRTLDIIQCVLGQRFNLLRIDGKTKEKDRQLFVDQFNSNSSKWMAPGM